jgi:uncharacterized zinc-type alcohol dehydrogenase-like protein
MPVHAYAATAAKQTLEPFTYDPGPLAPHEVEIRVTHCGICHSDVAMIDNDWGLSTYPLVPGHEVVGVIAAVGSGVPDRVKAGTGVGVGWQCGSCGACEWCGRGLESLCPDERATVVAHHGGFADVVRADWRFAVPIPDAIESAVAGPLFCGGNTVFTPLLRHNVNAAMRTAVVGIGGLGHLAVQFLAAFGCEVTAISSSHDKDDEAKKFGATRFIATRGTDELKRAANSFDFVLVTAGGTGLDWKALVDALRPQGKLVIAGPPEAVPQVPAVDLLMKEKTIAGGRTGSPNDIAQMLAFAARHGVRPLCEQFPMADVNAAMNHVRAGKARFRAVLAA